MQIVWGAVITLLALLAWGGQTIALLAPGVAAKLGLAEAREDVEPVFWSDMRGEAFWDALTLWTAVAAGILLILDRQGWTYFGLFSGGVFVYFAGRGIAARVLMMRSGFRIGARRSVMSGLVFLAIWGLMGLAMTIAAVSELRG